MTHEELINRIKQTIAALQTELGQLQEGTKAYANFEKQITKLTSALNVLSNAAANQSKDFQSARVAAENYFRALDAGQKRQSWGGQRYGLTSTRKVMGVPYPPVGDEVINATDAEFKARQNAAQVPFVIREELKPRTTALLPANISPASQASVDAQKKAEAEAEATARHKARVQQVEREQAEKAHREWLAGQKRQKAADDRARRAAVRAAEEQIAAAEQERKRIQDNAKIIATLPGGAETQKSFWAKARAIDKNFNPDTLRSADVDPSSMMTRLKFGYRTDEGVWKSTTFTVDKFGKTLVDTQKRFRDFGSAVTRDIGEVLKWSIAVAAIYGPMQKLGEITQLMIENEVALADVTVTLGNAQKETWQIFDNATKIAQQVGEETNNILKAYNAAYRATGGMESSTLRFVTANKLLVDSLTLSKLASIDEVEAIDLLSAALRQSGTPLDQGSKLLDKWVAVTRVANVDMNTLVTGFATLADAADAAGINQDKLNAIVATVAETTHQSGQEVANTTRALVSGFQSDQAQKKLQSLGISIQDASGEARGFLDIMQQIANLKGQGLISPEEFSKLTLVLGGGTRRQAAYATFIENLGKIPMIENASKFAEEGIAAEALSTKLDTVKTASIQLGNAFQSLANSLGDQGGILDIFKGFLSVLTSIVTALSTVTAAVGKAGPSLYLALGALAYLRTRGPDFASQTRQGITATVYDILNKVGKTGIGTNAPITQALFGGTREDVSRRSSTIANFVGGGRNRAGAAELVGAALPIAFAVGQNLATGQNKQAVGNALGGAIGYGLGLWSGGPGGALVGGAIGSAIGEGFVNAAENFIKKQAISQLFEPIFTPGTTPKAPGKETPEERQARLEKEALAEVRNLTDKSGGFGGALTQGYLNFIGNAQKFLGLPQGKNFQGVNEAQTSLIMLEMQKNAGRISQQDYDRVIKLLEEASAAMRLVAERGDKVLAEFPDEIVQAQKETSDRLLQDLNNRKIGAAAYQRGTEALAGFPTAVSQYYGGFGKTGGMQLPEFAKIFANVSAYAPTDSLDRLAQLNQEITEMDATLAKLDQGDQAYQSTLDARNQKVKDAIIYLRGLNEEILAQVKLLSTIDLSKYPAEDIAKIFQTAQGLQTAQGQANITAGAITPEQLQAYQKNLPNFTVQTPTGITNYNAMYPQQPLDQSYIQEAISKLTEEGKLVDKTKGVGWESLNISTSVFQRMLEQYGPMAERLQKAGVKLQPEDTYYILKDGFRQEKLDSKIVQFLLQKIEENTKELSGAYNLPEGASFWVPWQAAKLAMNNNNQGGLPGINEVSAPAPTESKRTTEQIQALNDMYDRKMQKWEEKLYPETPPKTSKIYLPEIAKEPTKFPEYKLPPKPTVDVPQAKTLGDIISSAFGPLISVFEKLPANIGDTFRQMFSGQLSTPDGGLGTSSIPTNPVDELSKITQSLQNFSTKLSLQIDNRTVVQLDGRVVASVVKQYLKDDLVKYSGGFAGKTVSRI